MASRSASHQPSILFLGSQMATGGAQYILLSQARWFHQQGYRVVAAFLYDREGLHKKWQTECSFPLINLGFRQPGGGIKNLFHFLTGIYRLVGLYLRGRFSVVETFTHHANLIGIPAAWIAGVPARIATHHGRIENFPKWMGRLHSLLINHRVASILVAVSEKVRQEAIQDEGVNPERISVIHNGVDLSEGEITDVNRRVFRQELGIKPDTIVILTAGRLRLQKGHQYLISAIPEVIAHFPDVVFTLAGDGPLRGQLDAQAKEAGILQYVRFLGNRADLPGVMGCADLFVLPSLWEGLPVVLLQAMVAGLPIIATRVGGIGEVIQDNENGLLIPPADPGALSQAITKLLYSPDLRNRLAVNGKVLAYAQFTIERMCIKYEYLFNKVSA